MYSLRPYQKAIVDAVRQAIAAGNRHVMVAAGTGTGKTVVAGHMMHAAHLRGNRSLFIAERKELVNQARDKLEAFGLQVGVMRGEDTILRPTDDCIVASIQTIRTRWHHLPLDIRLVVIDEAHLLYKDHIKLMKYWSAVPFIGLSATPMTRGLARYFDTLVRGPSIEELMQAGHLVGKVRTYSPRYEQMRALLATVHVRNGDYVKSDLASAMNRKEIIGDLPVEWRKHADGRQTVVFAVSIAHSKSIAEDFNTAGIKAAHVDGTMPDEERDKIIADYRAGLVQVLSSVAVLAVGFDAPETRCVMLARPTLSEMLHIQQAGRGMRPAPGKDDLVILDHAGNCLRHGLPQFFEVPNLDDGKRNASKRKKKDKHVTCSNCGYVLERGQVVCPSCAFQRPVPQNMVHFVDGELVESGVGLPGDSELSTMRKREWYCGFKWVAEQYGWKSGWAYHAYIEKFAVKPAWEWRDDPAVEPDDVVKRWAKHYVIKQRKRRRPVPENCNHCGSTNLVQGPGQGPYKASVRCRDCGRHLKWLSGMPG